MVNIDPRPFAPKPPLETLLFESSSVGIGTFRCHPHHPLFRDSGPTTTYCFVFPRTSVWIHHERDRPFVADPSVVTFYNAGDLYSRGAVAADGDRAEWFAVDPTLAAEIVSSITANHRPHGHIVFDFTHGRSDAATYLAQRQLCDAIAAGIPLDALEVEERVIALLETVVRHAVADARQPGAVRESRRRKVALCDDVRALLGANPGECVYLADLARAASCSVFHLCRAFKEVTGSTLHAYRLDLRLRMALERIRGGAHDLTRVALDLGFSSHSHFTAAFRRHFGVTPSAVKSHFGATRPQSWLRDH